MQGNFARIWQGIVIAHFFCIVMSNSSQSHDDAAPTVTLSKEWVIKKSGSKKIWNPDIQEKDGIKFVKLHKFDRQLTYFCLNASLDTRAGKTFLATPKHLML